jgi:hypothetical protein
MMRHIFFFTIIIFLYGCAELDETAFSHVTKEDGKTFIVDRTGYRWDVTQAESLGFKPAKFQYGMGKDAFAPLDDSSLSDGSSSVDKDMRVIGVEDGERAHAYSVSKLSRHEISNSMMGKKPIAVGY